MSRILHVIRSVNPAGGGPIEGVRQFARINGGDGHRIEVACLDAPDAPWLREFALPCHALGPGRGSYGYSARLVPWLRAHRDDYDAVVVDGIWQYHAFGVRRALRGTETPYFVFTHGMLDPWFKRTYPLKHLKKWLYWPWGDYRVLRDAQAVLFTCEEERRLARESFWLYRCRERVIGFGTGAPPDDAARQEAAFRAKFPETDGRQCLLFLGRIHEKKGVDLLLRAFASEIADKGKNPEHARWHLVIAGPDDNTYGSEMRALAGQLGIAERVTWTGMVAGDLKWGAFRRAAAFVLPSHQENFGIAVAEALACRVPVLISDKVNIWREIVADGAGLVGTDDLAGTRQLLARWAALTSEGRAEMAERAALCFRRRFDVARNARALIELLTEGKGGAHPGGAAACRLPEAGAQIS
ncbi:glycosyltransferase [Termitidicoccus mucosus]|uniref:Transferase n=1 Tax=Termitidicoccus mucosus TaxID=1184151 RepID=A0A178IFD2_9BACT|nr:transferase [Opitutaceae bacterium TSB47]